MKQEPFWGPANIRRKHTEFSRCVLALGKCSHYTKIAIGYAGTWKIIFEEKVPLFFPIFLVSFVAYIFSLSYASHPHPSFIIFDLTILLDFFFVFLLFCLFPSLYFFLPPFHHNPSTILNNILPELKLYHEIKNTSQYRYIIITWQG